MLFEVVVVIAALLAGAIASIAGFGIGSILTPLLAVRMGTKLSVAAVSFPHLAGTLLRFWLIRTHVDRRVLITFGITSAAGGLAGALLHVWFKSAALGYILGALLVFAGLSGLSGFAARMRFGRRTGWVAGALSGVFGGLVGNQGGIRSAALMGFDVSKQGFVATATAIALLVDFFRMPVYVAHAVARSPACLVYHSVGGYWCSGRHRIWPAFAPSHSGNDISGSRFGCHSDARNCHAPAPRRSRLRFRR